MNEKIELIDSLLSNFLKKMSNEDYLKMINSCPELKKYDNIMAKIDNGEYPDNYYEQITELELNIIIAYLNK